MLGEGWETWDTRDLVSLMEAAPQRQPGERWQGPSGRWFTKLPSGRVVPAKKSEEEHAAGVNAAHERIQGHLQRGHVSAAHAHELAGHLLRLNGAQLRDLKKRLNLKASGPKFEMAAKLATRALAGADGKAKQPREPAAAGAPPKAPQPGKVYNLATEHLTMDPSRFQYKLNTNAEGVTAELKSVRTWNPDFAGVVSVWRDPANGKTYVVNGHHRRELAGRLGVKDMAARYITAANAREARAIGALVNIAEGRGAALDAAKFMRDSGAGPADLEARGVSLKGKLAADAATLTRLSDHAFDRLARGQLDEAKALAVAKHLENHDLQDKLFGLLDKREEAGKDLSPRIVEEMAREMAATPTTKQTEATLFGDIESEESLFVPRNELKAHIRGELAREAGDFAAVASKRRAERVAGAGNVLDVERNKALAQDATQGKNYFDTLVNRKGPISDAINNAAADYAKGKTRSQRDAVKERAVEAVRRAIEAERGGAGPGDKGSPGAGQAEPGARPAALPGDARRGGAEPGGLTAPAGGSPEANQAAVAHAVRQLAAKHSGLIHLADLADATGLPREQLHAAVQALRRRGALTATPAEARHGQSERDRAAGFHENDQLMAYVSPREGGEEELARHAAKHGGGGEGAKAGKGGGPAPHVAKAVDAVKDALAHANAVPIDDFDRAEREVRAKLPDLSAMGKGDLLAVARGLGAEGMKPLREMAREELIKTIQGHALTALELRVSPLS
jgi:hypothetical protein